MPKRNWAAYTQQQPTAILPLLSLLGIIPSTTLALGTVGFESSSFMHTSSDRAVSASTFSGSIDGQFKNKIVKGEGSLNAYSFVTNKQSFTVESKEAYISTAPGLLGHHEFSVGRRVYKWNNVDDAWSQMSLWSPRFQWDALYPERIGLTGAFYNFESKRFTFTAYASPISIPERSSPIYEKDGTIQSDSPFFKPLPQTVNFQGVDKNVTYRLLMPGLQEILMRPAGAIRGEYRFDSGFYGNASSGIMPVHATQLAAEPYADVADTGDIRVDIRPQMAMRNLTTVEVGYKDPDSNWDLWLSGTVERPFRFENEPTWLNPVLTPSEIISGGSSAMLTSNFKFTGAFLFVQEEKYTKTGDLQDVNVDLPSRFPIKQAFQARGDLYLSWRTQANLIWVQDLIERNHWLGVNVQHRIPKMDLSVGAGVDMTFT